MFQAKTKKAILILLFCVLPGCVSPEAVKTDIQGIRNDMGQLEKVVDQNADKIENNTQIAEDLSVWRKDIQAETINYSGAGWVVVGTGVMALIFVGAGLLLIRAFMRRGNLLTMLTRAVKKVGKDSPHTVKNIKYQLKQCVHDGHFSEQDRLNLGNFAKKVGTFAEQK